MQCDTCRKRFKEGDDLVEVQDSILGYRSVVSLTDVPLRFCTAECLVRYYTETKKPIFKLQRKIP